LKLIDVSEVRTASIIREMINALMKEAIRSVNINFTIWRYISEDYKLHICRRENLKSHF
jgi:hypothetical protein